MATLGFHYLAANLCDYRSFYRLHSSIGIRRQNLRTICSAADDNQESMETEEEWSGEGSSVASESPVGTSKGASSLISTLNVQKALRGIAITDVDHYERLGIARGTSYEERLRENLCIEVRVIDDDAGDSEMCGVQRKIRR